MTPKRIQLRRIKGWKKPENTTVVTRNTRWGNPYVIGKDGTREQCVGQFQAMLLGRLLPEGGTQAYLNNIVTIQRARSELRGKNLACFCRLCPAHADGKPLGVECSDCAGCHSDVLLRWANEASV
jgi:hypothetical protein